MRHASAVPVSGSHDTCGTSPHMLQRRHLLPWDTPLQMLDAEFHDGNISQHGAFLCLTAPAAMQIERQLGNIERVRTLYEKYLEWSPANCTAWCKFAEFEQQYLGEIDRARAIYELAIAQPILDMPEVLWKVSCGAPSLEGHSFHFEI